MHWRVTRSITSPCGIARLITDGTCAETRFRRNGWVHLNWRGSQFSRLLAAEVCASAWVLLDTPCSEVVWEYWLPTPFNIFPFTSPPMRHCVPSCFKQAVQKLCMIIIVRKSVSSMLSEQFKNINVLILIYFLYTQHVPAIIRCYYKNVKGKTDKTKDEACV
jgi:hypothetical protein